MARKGGDEPLSGYLIKVVRRPGGGVRRRMVALSWEQSSAREIKRDFRIGDESLEGYLARRGVHSIHDLLSDREKELGGED